METQEHTDYELKVPPLQISPSISQMEEAAMDDADSPRSLAIIVTDEESWKRKGPVFQMLSETSQREMLYPDVAHSSSRYQFQIPFKQPALDPNFMDKVQTQNVCLQNLIGNDVSMFGVVKVKNLAYEKLVIAKYTMTGWKTETDVLCKYDPEYHTDSFDTFIFTIVLPRLSPHQKLSLVLKYVVNGEEYWDNNSGEDYVLYSEAVKPYKYF